MVISSYYICFFILCLFLHTHHHAIWACCTCPLVSRMLTLHICAAEQLAAAARMPCYFTTAWNTWHDCARTKWRLRSTPHCLNDESDCVTTMNVQILTNWRQYWLQSITNACDMFHGLTCMMLSGESNRVPLSCLWTWKIKCEHWPHFEKGMIK